MPHSLRLLQTRFGHSPVSPCCLCHTGSDSSVLPRSHVVMREPRRLVSLCEHPECPHGSHGHICVRASPETIHPSLWNTAQRPTESSMRKSSALISFTPLLPPEPWRAWGASSASPCCMARYCCHMHRHTYSRNHKNGDRKNGQ